MISYLYKKDFLEGISYPKTPSRRSSFKAKDSNGSIILTENKMANDIFKVNKGESECIMYFEDRKEVLYENRIDRYKLLFKEGEGDYGVVFSIDIEKEEVKNIQNKIFDFGLKNGFCKDKIDNWVENNKIFNISLLRCLKVNNKFYSGEKEREKILHEIKIMYNFKDKENIVNIITAWEQKKIFFIEMEYCLLGNLRNLINLVYYHKKSRFSKNFISFIILEISNGLWELKKHLIIHCDIKPDNIFITLPFRLKIGDFTISRKVDEILDEDGDKKYMPAEVLDGIFGYFTDVYSLGLIILELELGIVLPTYENWRELRENNYEGLEIDDLEDGEMIKRMIDKNYNLRPTIEEVIYYFKRKAQNVN